MKHLFDEEQLLLEAMKKIMRLQIMDVLIELEYEYPYTLRQMLPKLVKEFDPYEERIANKAVLILVSERKLPLEYDGKTSSDEFRYILK